MVRRSRNLMPLLAELKQRARLLKAETFALYLAARHPEHHGMRSFSLLELWLMRSVPSI